MSKHKHHGHGKTTHGMDGFKGHKNSTGHDPHAHASHHAANKEHGTLKGLYPTHETAQEGPQGKHGGEHMAGNIEMCETTKGYDHANVDFD